MNPAHTYTHTYTHLQLPLIHITYTHTHIHPHIYTSTAALDTHYLHTHIHPHIYTSTAALDTHYLHTHTHTYTSTAALDTHYLHTHTYTPTYLLNPLMLFLYIYIYFLNQINNRQIYFKSSLQELRNKFIFKIVPMLNPDGVIVGNYRCSLSARDLNRNYRHPREDSFPTVWHVKHMIETLSQKYEVGQRSK